MAMKTLKTNPQTRIVQRIMIQVQSLRTVHRYSRGTALTPPVIKTSASGAHIGQLGMLNYRVELALTVLLYLIEHPHRKYQP